MSNLLRTAVAVVVGYLLMAGLITIVQEVWFGGVLWGKTPLGDLAVAGFFTFVAAVIGAVTATAIARPIGRIAATVMCCLVSLEVFFFLVTGRFPGPLWFDLSAAASLVVGILLGAELFLRFTGRVHGHCAEV